MVAPYPMGVFFYSFALHSTLVFSAITGNDNAEFLGAQTPPLKRNTRERSRGELARLLLGLHFFSRSAESFIIDASHNTISARRGRAGNKKKPRRPI